MSYPRWAELCQGKSSWEKQIVDKTRQDKMRYKTRTDKARQDKILWHETSPADLNAVEIRQARNFWAMSYKPGSGPSLVGGFLCLFWHEIWKQQLISCAVCKKRGDCFGNNKRLQRNIVIPDDLTLRIVVVV
jgi:hypothetical protein